MATRDVVSCITLRLIRIDKSTTAWSGGRFVYTYARIIDHPGHAVHSRSTAQWRSRVNNRFFHPLSRQCLYNPELWIHKNWVWNWIERKSQKCNLQASGIALIQSDGSLGHAVAGIRKEMAFWYFIVGTVERSTRFSFRSHQQQPSPKWDRGRGFWIMRRSRRWWRWQWLCWRLNRMCASSSWIRGLPVAQPFQLTKWIGKETAVFDFHWRADRAHDDGLWGSDKHWTRLPLLHKKKTQNKRIHAY